MERGGLGKAEFPSDADKNKLLYFFILKKKCKAYFWILNVSYLFLCCIAVYVNRLKNCLERGVGIKNS